MHKHGLFSRRFIRYALYTLRKMPVMPVLAANNIRGCGEFRFQENMADKTDFLVNCTVDGRNWVSYRVSTARNKVEKLQ
jgi:hypothetical protein